MSQLEVDKIIPQSGTTLTIGDSGDTIAFGTGTTPQLGGDLGLNSNDITGTGNINITGKGTFSGAGSFEALELITSDTNRVYVTGNSSVSGDMWRIGTSASNPYLNIDGLQASSGILFRTGGTNERMRIDSSGNVGIGTSSPSSPLHIKTTGSSGTETEVLRLETTGTNDGSGITIDMRTSHINTQIAMVDGSGSYDGNIVFRTAGGSLLATPTERMRIDSSGRVNLCKGNFNDNVSASNHGWEIFQNSTAPFIQHGSAGTGLATKINFFNGNGDVGKISTNGSATTYATSSDYRLKENVVDIPNATERLKQLSPKRFNFIADADTTVDGFLAHEVQSVVPEAVIGTHNEVDSDGNPVYQGIDQSKLVPLLVASLKEALTEIDNLKARVDTLEGN
jgi:hypothetical protein